ncbi:MAG: serine hydrolase domain-containing protein [Gemmatimonadales bacterium]
MRPPYTLQLLGAAILLAAPAFGQSADIALKADQYLSVRAEMGNFTGAVLIAKGDRILFRKGYGYADIEKRIPFTPDTQHEVASVSKMFTAIAALKLRDKGKLNLSDSICLYLDDCPEIWKPITIDQLIHHTSGIPDYEDPLELGSAKYDSFMVKPGAMAQIVADARKKPLDFPPGTKFSYSNTAYNLLSYVVQKAAGRPFAEYVTSTLLKPAGMSHSGVIGVTKPTSLASGYTWGDLGWDKIVGGVSLTDGHMQRVPDLPLTQPDGDAWLFTTLDDLYRWSRIMDGGALVSPSEVAEVFKPELDGYGAGWFTGTAFERLRYRHTGGLPGRLTDFVKFPADSVTIIIFINADRGRASSVTRDLSSIVLGQPYDMPVRGTVVKLTPAQTSVLLGEYRMADGKLMTVSDDGTMIVAKLEGRYTAGLIPLSPTEFYMPLGDGRAIFTLDGKGKASALNMRYSGLDHIATR